MNDRKRWANKPQAREYMAKYRARVDTFDKDGKVIVSGPKGLSYWAAHDFVFQTRKA